VERIRAAQAAEYAATASKVDSVHAQGLHDRNWPIPFRDVRQQLREKVSAADMTAQENEAAAKKADQELAQMRKQLKGCQFTGEASKKAWSFFGGNN